MTKSRMVAAIPKMPNRIWNAIVTVAAVSTSRVASPKMAAKWPVSAPRTAPR